MKATRYAGWGMEIRELISIATYAMFVATGKFVPGRNANFLALAEIKIHGMMCEEARRLRCVRLPKTWKDLPREVSLNGLAARGPDEFVDLVPDTAPDALDQIISREALDEIEGAVNALPSGLDRVIMRKYLYEEKKPFRIARELCLGREKVRVRVFRSRNILRGRLRAEYGEIQREVCHA